MNGAQASCFTLNTDMEAFKKLMGWLKLGPMDTHLLQMPAAMIWMICHITCRFVVAVETSMQCVLDIAGCWGILAPLLLAIFIMPCCFRGILHHIVATVATVKIDSEQRRSEMQIEDKGDDSKKMKNPTVTVRCPGQQPHVAVRAQKALQHLQQSQPSDEKNGDEQVPLLLQLLPHEEQREPWLYFKGIVYKAVRA